MKAAAARCQLLLILLMSAVMLLLGTNGSLLLVQRTVTRTIVLQETIGKVALVLKTEWLYKSAVFCFPSPVSAPFVVTLLCVPEVGPSKGLSQAYLCNSKHCQ
ncbi:hypothetical protein STEG23_017203 [Scotinomys teguina]